MNKEQIMALQAGRELDALIEVEIYGEQFDKLRCDYSFCRCKLPHNYNERNSGLKAPRNYSTSIADAWEVVGWIGQQRINNDCTVIDINQNEKCWNVMVRIREIHIEECGYDNLPFIICKVSLLLKLELERGKA